MKPFTKQQYERLIKNGKPENTDQDHPPVVKLFTPDANCTWLISEILDEDTAFGLCDLGLGFPELGYVHLPEILAVRGRLGLPVERDICFEGKYPMSVYADAARHCQYITVDENILKQFVR